MNYQYYSEKLLNYSQNQYPISAEVTEAYRKCPRHLFVHQPYSMDEMYGDYPLSIYHDANFESTISQPSFVLLMLDMLDLRPGFKVLELGAGSGWNAALMGQLVGPTGKVVSLEIIPELAQQTKKDLFKLGFQNIEIIEGDGAEGYIAEAPYDRGIFTAGSSDLPMAFHDQIKEGGKLLFVLQTAHHADLLLLLQKRHDHFESIKQLSCQFVPMKGKHAEPKSSEMDQIVETRGKVRIYPKHFYPSPLPHQKMVIKNESVFFF